MSASTPADLAIAFRSLARRRREAIGDANPAAFADYINELQRLVGGAAVLLGTAADADAAATAIQSRPPEAWDEPSLDELRRLALEAGAVLRRLAAAAEEANNADH